MRWDSGRRWVMVLVPLMLLLAPLTAVGLQARPAVVLRDAETTEVLRCAAARDGSVVVFAFTHSMYGGRVEETLVVQGPALLRTGVRAERAAAAEYYGMYGEVVAEDGWYRVIVPSQIIRDLRFVADPIGQHELRLGPDSWRLTGGDEAPRHLGLRVDDVSARERRSWGC